MNAHTIDIMVTHLVQQCSCNGAAFESSKCNETTLVTRAPVLKAHLAYSNLDLWNSLLRRILLSRPSISVSKYSTIITVPRPFASATWRETNHRKVLAPLPLMQNCDNLFSDYFDIQSSRKRSILFHDLSIVTKHAKIEPNNNLSHIRPCKVLLKRTSIRNMYIEYKCLSRKSSVKLLDVLREIPQSKQEEKPLDQVDFMLFLNLNNNHNTTEKPLVEIKTSHPVKLVNYHQIPFSSDYGRHLLAKDKHFVQEDVVLRKLERTEWYLKTTQRIRKISAPHLEVACDRPIKNVHRFKFPRRQCHQNHQSIKVGFLNSICRPICVNVERMDLNAFIRVQEEKRQAIQIKDTMLEQALSVVNKMITEAEITVNDVNKFDEIDLLDLGSEDLILNRTDVVCNIVSDESINKPAFLYNCENIIMSTLSVQCTEKPIVVRKKRRNGAIRRSSRLLINSKSILN